MVDATIVYSTEYGGIEQDKSVEYSIETQSSDGDFFNIGVHLSNEDNYIDDDYNKRRFFASQLAMNTRGVYHKAVYIIILRNYDHYEGEDNPIHRYIPTNVDDKENVIDSFQIIHIELPKVMSIDQNSKAIEKLAYLLCNAHRMEAKTIADIKLTDPAWGQIYQDYLDAVENRYFMAMLAAKEKLLIEAEDVKAFAIDKALSEEKTKMIKSLHAEGLDTDSISRVVNIPPNQVSSVIDEIKE